MAKSLFPKKIHTSVDKAAPLAAKIAPKLRGGEVFALIGPLGAGKTTFVQHLAKELGYNRRVTSPTFTLLQTYLGKNPKTGKMLYIYHLDLYRLETSLEAIQSGLTEAWGTNDSVTLVEWADKSPDLLPKNSIAIVFKLL